MRDRGSASGSDRSAGAVEVDSRTGERAAVGVDRGVDVHVAGTEVGIVRDRVRLQGDIQRPVRRVDAAIKHDVVGRMDRERRRVAGRDEDNINRRVSRLRDVAGLGPPRVRRRDHDVRPRVELRFDRRVGHFRTARGRREIRKLSVVVHAEAAERVPDRDVVRIEQPRSPVPVRRARIAAAGEDQLSETRRLDQPAVARLRTASRGQQAEELRRFVRPQDDLPAISVVQRVGVNFDIAADEDSRGVRDRVVVAVQVAADEHFAAMTAAGCIDVCSAEQTDLLTEQMNRAADSIGIGIRDVDVAGNEQRAVLAGIDMHKTAVTDEAAEFGNGDVMSRREIDLATRNRQLAVDANRVRSEMQLPRIGCRRMQCLTEIGTGRIDHDRRRIAARHGVEADRMKARIQRRDVAVREVERVGRIARTAQFDVRCR